MGAASSDGAARCGHDSGSARAAWRSEARHARSGAAGGYDRRRHEETGLYGVVQRELETFLARTRSQEGSVPRFVERELCAYLRCGILAHGFVRGPRVNFTCIISISKVISSIPQLRPRSGPWVRVGGTVGGMDAAVEPKTDVFTARLARPYPCPRNQLSYVANHHF